MTDTATLSSGREPPRALLPAAERLALSAPRPETLLLGVWVGTMLVQEVAIADRAARTKAKTLHRQVSIFLILAGAAIWSAVDGNAFGFFICAVGAFGFWTKFLAAFSSPFATVEKLEVGDRIPRAIRQDPRFRVVLLLWLVGCLVLTVICVRVALLGKWSKEWDESTVALGFLWLAWLLMRCGIVFRPND